MHLDDQLAGRRFVQPFETRFISTSMTKMLNEVNKIDERSQQERKIIDQLNKKNDPEGGGRSDIKDGSKSQNAANSSKNSDVLQTYHSKFSLKIFKLIIADQLQNNTESKRTNYSTPCIEQSISDILVEAYKGRRIYTINLKRKNNHSKKHSQPSARSVFSSSIAAASMNQNSVSQASIGPASEFVEVDVFQHTFKGQTSHVLIVRNVTKYLELLANETKSYLDLTWLDMLAQKFLTPNQQILQACQSMMKGEGRKPKSEDASSKSSVSRRLKNGQSNE